ncbi:MAG: VCBS repeat-containing protein [Candidatus Sabulitectum sp.]|nr:VCBS repeat-containing protein [Candidatus Sabulitectum sp.]
MIRIHTLLPAMLVIAGSGLSSDVFKMQPSWTYHISNQSGLAYISSLCLDDDSIPDLIMGNRPEGYLKAFYGVGDGSFLPGEQYAFPDIRWIETADINDDGYMDVVARSSSNSADSFYVFLNSEDGIFESAPITVHSYFPTMAGSFSIGYIDSDSILDIVSVNKIGEIYLFSGSGDGSFTAQMIYQETGNSTALALGDVDDDGDQDIVVMVYEQLSVLLNNGDGSFIWNGYYGFFYAGGGNTIGSIDLGYLNDDSFLDIACCPSGAMGTNALHTLLGQGDGSFVQIEPVWFVDGVALTQTRIGDYDLDGNMDVFYSGNHGVLLMLGTGDGLISLDFLDYLTPRAWQVTASDLDLDGDIDFIQATGDTPTSFQMEVFLNKTIQLGIEEEEESFVDLIPIVSVTSNPVSESTGVCLSLSEPSFCILNVHNIHGRLVSQVFNGDLSEGNHQLTWNSSVLPAGCYTLVLDTQSECSRVRCVKID